MGQIVILFSDEGVEESGRKGTEVGEMENRFRFRFRRSRFSKIVWSRNNELIHMSKPLD